MHSRSALLAMSRVLVPPVLYSTSKRSPCKRWKFRKSRFESNYSGVLVVPLLVATVATWVQFGLKFEVLLYYNEYDVLVVLVLLCGYWLLLGRVASKESESSDWVLYFGHHDVMFLVCTTATCTWIGTVLEMKWDGSNARYTTQSVLYEMFGTPTYYVLRRGHWWRVTSIYWFNHWLLNPLLNERGYLPVRTVRSYLACVQAMFRESLLRLPHKNQKQKRPQSQLAS